MRGLYKLLQAAKRKAQLAVPKGLPPPSTLPAPSLQPQPPTLTEAEIWHHLLQLKPQPPPLASEILRSHQDGLRSL